MGRLPAALSRDVAAPRRRQHEVDPSAEGDRKRASPVAQLSLSERGAARREDVWGDTSITTLLALSFRGARKTIWEVRSHREAPAQGSRYDRRGPANFGRGCVPLGMRGGVSELIVLLND